MPSQPTELAASAFQLMRFIFDATQLPISQVNTVLKALATAATSGALANTGIVMPFDGSVVGIGVNLSAATSAGTLSVIPNLTPPGGSLADCTQLTVAYAGALQYKSLRCDANVNPFVAGALLGARYNTNAGYLPTTLDMIVDIYIQFNKLAF